MRFLASRGSNAYGARRTSPGMPTKNRASRPLLWWGLLLSAICFEGIARRFLPVPGPILYVLKDCVLLAGFVGFRRDPAVAALIGGLAGPLPILLGATAAWCAVTLAFQTHPSALLGFLGMRQYLLWWLAPTIVASALADEQSALRAGRFLSWIAIAVATVAAYQFTLPPTEAINAYVWDNEPGAVALVGTTGRVRVSSTFSYISGFSNFVSLVTPILLAAGASTARGNSRLTFLAVGALAATTPMGGGRAAVLYVALGWLAVLGVSGGFRSRKGMLGLAIVVGGVVGGVLLAPDASQGILDRFDTHETGGRFRDLALVFPPLAITTLDYPFLGLGVGSMQNAAAWLGVESGWAAELEPHRLLIEVGVPGYLLVWLTRLALAVALVRLGLECRRKGLRTWAGASWAYAVMGMLMPLTIDHVAQALYFCGVGVILSRLTVSVRPSPRRV